MRNENPRPLDDITVLDFSRVRAGPTCVRILADFGANVIKIEPPQGVDANASMFAANRFGSDFQNLNRNKRSLTLNLKASESKEILRKLIHGADVIVENWRPDVKQRLGLDYETVSKINRRIILASIAGYGQTGPYVQRPAFDQIIQGIGGLMSVTGTQESGPLRVGLAISDSSSGIYAAIAILLALHERAQSNKGQWVHVSLLHALIAMMDFQVARYINNGELPIQEGNNHPTNCPMGVFHGADGKPFNLGVAGDGMWHKFCKLVGESGWLTDKRFSTSHSRVEHRIQLNNEVERALRAKTSSEWIDALNASGIPAGPILNVAEMLKNPQVISSEVVATAPISGSPTNGAFVTEPIIMERTPARIIRGAPELGEHTVEILSEIGYTEPQIDELHRNKVI